MDFVTKDSGQRDQFPTGAKRDVQEGKTRYDLVPVEALKRLADLLARGAAKYGEHNFEKGIPFSRMLASMLRHVYDWEGGDRSEDHLAAVAFNAFALMFFECQIVGGKLPRELDDLGVLPEETASDRIPVYISGPMSLGDRVQNLAAAMTAMRELISLGYAPLNPHLTFFCEPFIQISHATWVDIDLPWVRRSRAVLRLPGESQGAAREVQTANEAGIPVFTSIDVLHSHFNKTTTQCGDAENSRSV